MKLMLSIVTFWVTVTNANFLDDIPKCTRSNPKFNDCLKSAIERTLIVLEKGVPELGLPSMQPFVIPTLEVPFSFDKFYSNVRCYNHASSKINSLESTVTDATFWLILKGYNPKTLFVADYVYRNAIVNGKDFSSTGNVTFTHYGYDFEMAMDGTVSAQFLAITNCSLTMNASNFEIHFENEDLKLSNWMNDFFSKNWQAIFDEVRSNMGAVYANVYKDFANTIFSKIEFNHLFPKN